jgi:hypothetical protein
MNEKTIINEFNIQNIVNEAIKTLQNKIKNKSKEEIFINPIYIKLFEKNKYSKYYDEYFSINIIEELKNNINYTMLQQELLKDKIKLTIEIIRNINDPMYYAMTIINLDSKKNK